MTPAPRPDRRNRRGGPSWIDRHRVLAVVLAAAALGAVLSRLGPWTAPPADDRQRYHGKNFTVARVVDGDTIDLDIYDPLRRKAHTRVRLWGVDTPEKGWNGRPAMYYGEQATTFVAQHVLGKTVRIELHPRKRTRDKYDRLLAYVWLPETGQMLNELLVETGHAYADLRFDHLYKARFVRLERTARKQKRGLWAAVRPEQWPAWRRRMVRASGPKSRPAPASHARPR